MDSTLTCLRETLSRAGGVRMLISSNSGTNHALATMSPRPSAEMSLAKTTELSTFCPK